METGNTDEAANKITLESLDLNKNLVDEAVIKNVVHYLTYAPGSKVPQIKIPSNSAFLIPMLARAIIEDERYQPRNVSIKDIKAIRRDVNFGARLISKFSKRKAYQFDKFTQRKATESVTNEVERVREFVAVMGNLEDPRGVFLEEIQGIYDTLPEYSYETRHFTNLVELLDELNGSSQEHWFKQEFPVMGAVWALVPSKMSHIGSKLDIATPEIYKGMEKFLKSHGIRVESTEFHNQPDGIMRGPAELLASDKLAKVDKDVPFYLQSAFDLLPENGNDFKRNVQGWAKNILEAKKQGISNEQLARAVFKTLTTHGLTQVV